jgi:uncharacterized protein
MTLSNKEILIKANSYVTAGDNESFLTYCTDDATWEFIGDQTLVGKSAVRAYMAATYIEPPKFDVEHIVAEADLVTVIGKISLKDANGQLTDYNYCDVWRFRDGKMAGLKAFVIEVKKG